MSELGEEGGELALEAQRRAAREVEGGLEAFFPFFFSAFSQFDRGDCDGSSKQATAVRSPHA